MTDAVSEHKIASEIKTYDVSKASPRMRAQESLRSPIIINGVARKCFASEHWLNYSEQSIRPANPWYRVFAAVFQCSLISRFFIVQPGRSNSNVVH